MGAPRNALYQCLVFASQFDVTFKVYSGEEEGLMYYQGINARTAFKNTKFEDSAVIHIVGHGHREFILTVNGNAPDESISDCTAYGFVDRWCELTNFGQGDLNPDLTWEEGAISFNHFMEKSHA